MSSRWLSGLSALLLAFPALAALPLTPFEQAPTQPLPRSAVISKYLHELDAASPLASVTQLGLSAGNRPVEALLISEEPEFLREGRPSSQRLTVMLVGSQHGNEPSGTEGLQSRARRLLDEAACPAAQLVSGALVVALAGHLLARDVAAQRLLVDVRAISIGALRAEQHPNARAGDARVVRALHLAVDHLDACALVVL